MSLKPVQFTYEEVRIITNAFSMHCFRLEQSGDYPEKARDKVIYEKLLDWLYTAPEDISLATCGAEEDS